MMIHNPAQGESLVDLLGFKATVVIGKTFVYTLPWLHIAKPQVIYVLVRR
jgi:hypothetical protein